MKAGVFGSIAAAGVAALALGGGGAAAAPVSDRFDGSYEGTAKVVDWAEAGACRAPDRYRAAVSDGDIVIHGPDGAVLARGFVTADGFFTGRHRLAGGGETPFEGSAADGSLVGGVMPGEGCAWLVTLERTAS